MKRMQLMIATILLASTPTLAADKLQVVTTTATLATLVQAVGGENVEAQSIVHAGQDPHFIEAKPSYMLAARDADLFVCIGLDLETAWQNKVLEGSRNADIQPGAVGYLDVSGPIKKLDLPSGQIDRSQGDVHALGNPHYWLDPFNGRLIANIIKEKLIQLQPGNKQTFERGYQTLINEIDQGMFGPGAVSKVGGDTLWQALQNDKPVAADAGSWHQRLSSHKGKPLITFHRSWVYLLDRFGLNSIGEIEEKPGIPPSPSHLLGLIKAGKRNGVRHVIIEPFYNDKSARFVADKIGAELLALPQSTGSQPTTQSYVGLINHLVNQIASVYER